MKHLLTWPAFALVAGLVAGCNTIAGQPHFEKAELNPPVLAPDTSGVISVKVADPHDIVDRVEGVVTEDTRITLPLHDDGVPPDETAGDDVWSLEVEVPFDAPPGDFTLAITAYRENGLPINVKRKGEEAAPMTTTVPVVIQYADEETAEEERNPANLETAPQ
ncbi:MAG: hypothetical protein ACLFTT_18845 [Candidatus Hydrogenedentota bacterium]